MKPMIKVYITNDEKEKLFGEGPYRLLLKISEGYSLRTAASSMGMAYTKALKILNQAEEMLGFPLTHRTTGGKNGGGSSLTYEGTEFLKKYEDYKNRCIAENEKIFDEIFLENHNPGGNHEKQE